MHSPRDDFTDLDFASHQIIQPRMTTHQDLIDGCQRCLFVRLMTTDELDATNFKTLTFQQPRRTDSHVKMWILFGQECLGMLTNILVGVIVQIQPAQRDRCDHDEDSPTKEEPNEAVTLRENINTCFDRTIRSRANKRGASRLAHSERYKLRKLGISGGIVEQPNSHGQAMPSHTTICITKSVNACGLTRLEGMANRSHQSLDASNPCVRIVDCRFLHRAAKPIDDPSH